MGETCSKSSCFKSRPHEIRVLLAGLDDSGKTRILYSIEGRLDASGKPIKKEDIAALDIIEGANSHQTTIGYNMESFLRKETRLNIWDVGGQKNIRPLWRHYFAGTKAVIYVIDGTAHARIDEAIIELRRLVINRDLKECPFLIMVNKQDLDGCLSSEQVSQMLLAHNVIGGESKIHLIETSAKTKNGLNEGILWILDHLKNQKH